MEATPPGLVGVMECGVGQLQLVKVSLFSINLQLNYTPYPTATCSENLPLISNGGITYVGGSTDNRPVGTMAIYSCFGDNRLVGVAVRTCQSNGTWSSTTAPVCEGKELVAERAYM